MLYNSQLVKCPSLIKLLFQRFLFCAESSNVTYSVVQVCLYCQLLPIIDNATKEKANYNTTKCNPLPQIFLTTTYKHSQGALIRKLLTTGTPVMLQPVQRSKLPLFYGLGRGDRYGFHIPTGTVVKDRYTSHAGRKFCVYREFTCHLKLPRTVQGYCRNFLFFFHNLSH